MQKIDHIGLNVPDVDAAPHADADLRPDGPPDMALISLSPDSWPFPTITRGETGGTKTFLLSPGQSAIVQLGDIFDETGVLSATPGELASGTEYMFRVKANGDPGSTTGGSSLLPASPYSPTQSAITKVHSDQLDCVHTQGFWKNHPDVWPVTTLKLGSVR